MSTRCQIKVRQVGLDDWNDEVTLYHHCDGYPESDQGMVAVINRAFQKYGASWEAGRAGKVASFLCATQPGQFEPEEGHELHCDLDYYYLLGVVNHNGSIAERPVWSLEIFRVETGSSNLEAKPVLKKLFGGSLESAVQRFVSADVA